MVVGRRHGHDGHVGVQFVETQAELTDVFSCLLLRVNHDAVGTTLLHVGAAAFQCIVDALAGDEALAAGNDHEVLCHLGVLAGTYLLAEVLDGVLRLNGIGAKERVLLQAHLVLNDNSRDAVALQCAYRKHKVLQLAARVAVVDDGLRRALQNVRQVLHTCCQVNSLNVGLTLRCRVCERRTPHAVEGVHVQAVLHLKVLADESRQSVVYLQDAHHGLGLYQSAQCLQAYVGCRAYTFYLLVERR